MPLEASRGVLQSVGNYDLLQKIADGGMGSVFKARQRLTGDIVAIKVVPSNLVSNGVLLQRFEQEFRAAGKIDHPNVVRAIEFGQEGSTPYLVMEFVDGETLGQRIERQGKVELNEALKIVAQIAQGLHKAHKQGMIHRDVKPDNILITPDGVAKLADMGLVKETETDMNLTRTGRGLGTPQFMAPEQFRNAKNADRRCDIYSLAATLYMALTGELPFRSCSPLDAWMKKMRNDFTEPKEIVGNLPDRVNWAILRAMSADPEKRPDSCREFVEDLTGRSTKRLTEPSGVNATGDLWYLMYSDEEGTKHVVKGSLVAIRHCLKDGLMGTADHVLVGRSKQGPFEPLRSTLEFRDLVIAPAAMPVGPGPAPSRRLSAEASEPATHSAFVPPPVRRPPPPPVTPRPSFHTPAIDFSRRQGERPEFDWLTLVIVVALAAGAFLFGLYVIGR
jgi:serine/threonine protein kinase